jgi:UDP-glucose:(heptosyl)LPS alpha-1,3-glucosyltransferase
MKLAFCLFEYFPFGGMQRDCVRIARACVEGGMDVTIFTREWVGPHLEGIHVVVLPTSGMTNAGKVKRFVDNFQAAIAKESFDGVVGFSKMPGLDVYYAADPCFVEKAQKHSFLYRCTPHYRTYAAFEKAVFGAEAQTEVLMINERSKTDFQTHYHTPDSRFHMLPPGIEPNRCAPIDYVEKRALLREGFSLKDDEKLILFIGSGFKTKGLDRAIQAMSHLSPERLTHTQMWIIGEDDPKPYQKTLNALKLDDKVFFLGGRNDIPELLWTADVLLHPAYAENAGMVLLEAVVAGLPVLTTDTCGYAHYVQESQAGIVLASPFDLQECTMALEKLLNEPEPWRSQGIAFGLKKDLYSMVEAAQNLIEMIVRKKHA